MTFSEHTFIQKLIQLIVNPYKLAASSILLGRRVTHYITQLLLNVIYCVTSLVTMQLQLPATLLFIAIIFCFTILCNDDVIATLTCSYCQCIHDSYQVTCYQELLNVLLKKLELQLITIIAIIIQQLIVQDIEQQNFLLIVWICMHK